MTPEQIALVEASLAEAAPHLDSLAGRFYERLFAAAPDAEALFVHDRARQRAVFAVELRSVVTAIRDYDAFVAHASSLGVRHGEYGVRAAHYRVAGGALIAVLAEDAQSAGTAWSPEHVAAWRAAYDLIAETMMQGAANITTARAPRPAPPDPRPRA
jgi:hemoglobin-like flavoprotein